MGKDIKLTMKPMNAYLIRALYTWIIENRCTPHIVVDALYPAVKIPTDYVQEEKITFNIAPQAIERWSLTEEALYFEARFSGVKYEIYLPIFSIVAIYAAETQQGMMFSSFGAPIEEVATQRAIEMPVNENHPLPCEPPFRTESQLTLVYNGRHRFKKNKKIGLKNKR